MRWTVAAGCAAALLIGLVAGYWYLSRGPSSFRAEYARLAAVELARSSSTGVLADADLAPLPPPIARYVRLSGAVGQPRVVNFRAKIRGRIRGGPNAGWMGFEGEQTNRVTSEPSRLFFIDARMFGLPVDVFHAFLGPSATMRVTLLSALTMVDARGPEMDQAETVTLFNDICVLAPAALVDAAVRWEPLDQRSVRGTFTRGACSARAVLSFNDAGELVDFVSDDRLRASSDGSRFIRQRWSTPLSGYTRFGTRRISATGEARWHAPAPENEFTYLKFEVADIA
jgi:hypothetical protein